jgi:hypothetical protein
MCSAPICTPAGRAGRDGRGDAGRERVGALDAEQRAGARLLGEAHVERLDLFVA